VHTAEHITLTAHIAAGTAGLIAFCVPIATAKGSRAHRRAGTVFVAAMLTTAATGFLLAGWAFASPNPARTPAAWFLLYIATLTAFGATHGLRMTRFKHRHGPHPSVWDFFLPAALLLGGPALITYGFVIGNTLLATFPTIGVALGGATLCYLMRDPPDDPAWHAVHWKQQHIVGMFTAGIAAVTAFIVTGAANAARTLPTDAAPAIAQALASPAAWFAPTAALVPLLVYFARRERLAAAHAHHPGTAIPARITVETKPTAASDHAAEPTAPEHRARR
jgi:hypothetical protein